MENIFFGVDAVLVLAFVLVVAIRMELMYMKLEKEILKQKKDR